MIHLGDTHEGQRIEIPVGHTGVFGQTGVGKTRTLKYMLKQAIKEDYRVLIIDSKLTHPEFQGIGQDIPLYLEESTDPDIFRSLIEQVRPKGKGNMERYRGGFIELCQPADAKAADNFNHIGARLEQKLRDTKIRGYTRTMYAEIQHDYKRLMGILGKYDFARRPELTIPGPIARMATRELPNVALQGLVLRSVLEEILRRGEKRLVVLIDEAPNFCHQKYYNPAKEAIQQLDAQGRSNELWGWYSGQTLSGFDKSNMKNLWYWVMGREMETNEAKAVHETQTSNKLTTQEIRKLKVREFLVATPEDTYVVTVPDVPADKTLFAEIPLPRTGQRADPVIDGPIAILDVPANDGTHAMYMTMDPNADPTLSGAPRFPEVYDPEDDETLLELEAVIRIPAKVLRGAILGELAQIANVTDITLKTDSVNVTVKEELRPEELKESTYEGKLVILIAEKIWTTKATMGQIQKMITQQWGNTWGGPQGKALRVAIEKLMLRPYMLIEGEHKHGWGPTAKGRAVTKEMVK